MESGLVSIVMPAYNAENYIGKAIESVLTQSYPHWELIIVNDGSKDNTANVASSYIQDPRLKLIHQVNGGEAAARNTALEHAQGDYISFLDADDLYLPNALADRAEFLNRCPEYGAVVSDGYFFDDNDKTLGRISEIRLQEYEGNILEPLVLNPSVVSVPVGVMVHRSAVERYQLRFDTNVGYGTDWDFWIRLARHVEFGYLDRLTYKYRVHYTNMTRAIGQQKVKQNWARGRMKVLNSDWFEELSAYTRRRFFYDLLVDLLANQPHEQESILNSRQFENLPRDDQAQIWRQVGIDYLSADSQNQRFAINCLQKAALLCPEDKKTRTVLQVLQLGTLPTLSILYLWRSVHGINVHLRALGRRKPKPVPIQLRPAGD